MVATPEVLLVEEMEDDILWIWYGLGSKKEKMFCMTQGVLSGEGKMIYGLYVNKAFYF